MSAPFSRGDDQMTTASGSTDLDRFVRVVASHGVGPWRGKGHGSFVCSLAFRLSSRVHVHSSHRSMGAVCILITFRLAHTSGVYSTTYFFFLFCKCKSTSLSLRTVRESISECWNFLFEINRCECKSDPDSKSMAWKVLRLIKLPF
jgi:hypothetical protein